MNPKAVLFAFWIVKVPSSGETGLPEVSPGQPVSRILCTQVALRR
jgi:hypothetical protein